MRIRYALPFLVLALAGCVSQEALRHQDAVACQNYGFTPGNDAFNTCMQQQAIARQAHTDAFAVMLGQ